MSRITASILLAIAFGLSQPALGAETQAVSFDKAVQPFFTKHCYECHGPEADDGDFRLDRLQTRFSNADDGAAWTKVLQKLESGKMPPKKKPRPPVDDVAKVVRWVRGNLVAAQRAAAQADGRVVLRRLNRTEYQHTVRDLFAIDADLKDLLPQDNSAQGFDNVGEALNLSSVLLERYLEAADAALDAAIVTTPRPTTRKQRFSYKDERRVKNHKSYLPVDDAIVFFSAGYSPTEINQFRAPAEGNYRVRVSAYAYQSDQPVTLRVYGGVGIKRHLVGYADAPPNGATAEFVTRLGRNNTVRVVPYGTYITRWNQAVNEKGAGLAVRWVEIEGPLIDSWPPPSHRTIFGDLPIGVVNADEIKRNRRTKPIREVVSDKPIDDARAILDRLLPKLFRRPVSNAKRDIYLAVIRTHLEKGYTFQQAVRVGLKAAMCSPDFLYLPERPGKALDDYGLASRLSYFFWSTSPDDELLAAAASGKLSDPAELRRQTERLLNDPRAARLTEHFVGQWLDLREIDFTTPDKLLYPEFDELLQVSMVRETQLFFEELLKHDLSVVNVVDSDFAMLNERLARHYGVPGVRGQAFRKVKLPADSVRGGVLTQASVLKVTANGTNTSPVLRGVWVLENIVGQHVPPPPANVPAVEPDIRGATSIRDQLAKHRQDETCASCHRDIDPAGFALENFDVIGGWRDHYRSVGEGQRVNVQIDGRGVRYKRGLPVDAGDVLADGQRFDGIADYKRLLLKDKARVARCVTEKLLTYATGGVVRLSDRAAVDAIVARAAGKQYGLRTLLHEVVQSDLFKRK